MKDTLSWTGRINMTESCSAEQNSKRGRTRRPPVEENLWRDNDEWSVIWLGLESGTAPQINNSSWKKSYRDESIIASINNSSCLSSVSRRHRQSSASICWCVRCLSSVNVQNISVWPFWPYRQKHLTCAAPLMSSFLIPSILVAPKEKLNILISASTCSACCLSLARCRCLWTEL